MNSAIPALLALLLVSSLVAIPVVAGPGDGVQDRPQAALQEQTVTNETAAEGTTNRLSLDGEIRSEYVEYGADFGTLLASTDDELRDDYEQYTILDRRFDEVTTDEQKQMVQAANENIEDRADELEERERNAVRDHASGEMSTTELLQILLRNYHEAAVLSDALDDIEGRADRIPGYSLPIKDKQNELEMHRTPVRTSLETAARGLEDEITVAVETSESGYTLTTLDNNYVREATRFDNRKAAWGSEFDDITDAYNHAGELYPWVFETGRSPTANEHTSVNLYRIQASHDQGRFEAYLDGGTGNVHREVQELSHRSLPIETETRWSENGLNVSLSETPRNGPAEITVTDAETDEPETATVTVDGFEVDQTDNDGVLWFTPPSGTYDLVVESDSNSVEITVPE
ncbi:DUF7096 domain-containing protein [Natronorubrum halophilum]|uniref:DUF7096 domain-containing protein n=1 Tax=Natronorubrum halophilum TaxID=1702106 RepID=UPI000EF6954F|nr:hypothetical protein [Natronorubrum halophilum]